MKTNLPVTLTERLLKPDAPIVTETDLKGIITYANQSFVDISGFAAEELIGKSHNVVRHPDMPPAAFADLWETIQRGMPWQGLVKNRAKNGDFYWVQAYVSPIRKHRQVIGYRSIRVAPRRDQVESAEALYQAIRQGRANLPRTRTLSLLQRIPFARRAWLAFAGIAASYLGLAALATLGLPPIGLWSAAAACIVLTLAAGGWWVNAAQRGIDKIQAGMEEIEEGNFAIDLKIGPTDEFGNIIIALQTVAMHLRSVIADILAASQRLAKQSGDLDTVSAGLAERTGSQSDRVMQVSAATEEMSVSVNEISHATEQMVTSADQAQQVVLTAEENMRESLAAIQKIVTVVGNARTELDSLRLGVEKIGSVTVTIKEIAEQTNLLALNA
ncbi:MAG TPA: PAS domain-containing methyl-accepting chemotaxis protein, partial [Rhodocyclaceae bacterium]|nr:PAS domain-containing methyl-accepting chemotaxis protein [Rhodocyclaceae bacterium]